MNSFSYTSTFYMYIGAIDFKLNVINDVFNDEDKNERIVAADYERFSFSAMTIL